MDTRIFKKLIEMGFSEEQDGEYTMYEGPAIPELHGNFSVAVQPRIKNGEIVYWCELYFSSPNRITEDRCWEDPSIDSILEIMKNYKGELVPKHNYRVMVELVDSVPPSLENFNPRYKDVKKFIVEEF